MDTLNRVWLPLLLLVPAVLAAGVVAYGVHPAWVQYAHGLDGIVLARRTQWPLVTLSLLLCVALLALVISGKRRAWWLLGLAPVLMLFVHRFASDPTRGLAVLENPAFVPADRATFLADDDFVVGLQFQDQTYAYPYAALYQSPVVVQDDHDRRMILIWSAFANDAFAANVSREVRARELEIVSIPANALLIYDGRLGQFINGVTGITPRNETPIGFKQTIETTRCPWRQWRSLHPTTQVLNVAAPAGAPNRPILPRHPLRPNLGGPPIATRVAVVHTTPPVAIPLEELDVKPMQFSVGEVPVLLFRDGGGPLRAFDRRIDDLRPKFVLNTDPRRPKAKWTDRDTGAGWTAEGVAIDGPAEIKGKKLARLRVSDDVYWGVMKHWWPELELRHAELAATRPANVDRR